MESGEQVLQRAILTISQSDPLIKLLDQVKLEQMKPTDAELRAVTDSWISIYQKVIESGRFNTQTLRHIDPNPRLAMLIEYKMVRGNQRAITDLQLSFERT